MPVFLQEGQNKDVLYLSDCIFIYYMYLFI